MKQATHNKHLRQEFVYKRTKGELIRTFDQRENMQCHSHLEGSALKLHIQASQFDNTLCAK
jgi:hypothetical protein